MKKIYFVRHGETVSNVKKLWQDGSDELTPAGLVQADILAERLKNLSIDIAVTSPYKRAVQTADQITKQTGLQFTESALFAEPTVPSSTVGHAFQVEVGNPIFDYFAVRDLHTENPDFRYEDEETINEMMTRIKDALSYLDQLPAENILVVTHGTILRTIISYVLHQDIKLSPFELFKAGWNFEITNASISVIRKKEGKPWTVLTFNDHAHFAE